LERTQEEEVSGREGEEEEDDKSREPGWERGGGLKNLSRVLVLEPVEVPVTRGRLLGEGGGVRSGKGAVSSVLVRTREVDEEERGL
jgi:hypothetical protein